LEIAGAGMVHPVVLQNGGYDSDEWSGFAFGTGVERPAMLKHGIDDIRLFYGNDLRFLRQF
jgi:phenylalanyl-tRNA synthetase alpha chain